VERDLERVNVKTRDGVLTGHFNWCPTHVFNGQRFVTLHLVLNPTPRCPFPIVSFDPVPTIELDDPENYGGFVRVAPSPY
jgi:hypothetical protein